MLAGNDAYFPLSGYWLSTLGDAARNVATSVATDSQNNSYVIGLTTPATNGKALLLVKYDTAGAIQWQRTLSGTADDEGAFVTVDSSDNVYIVGRTFSQGVGTASCLIAKYDTAGAIQWQRTLGGTVVDYGNGVATDSSGNVYMAAESASQASGYWQSLLVKYNSAGTIQWQRSLNANSDDFGKSVAIDSSGSVYLLGYTIGTTGSYELLIAKYNSAGTIQWQKTLAGASNEFLYSLAVDSNDNIYAAGATRSEGAGSYSCLLVKYNSAGTLQWQKILYGTGNDQYRGVAVDSNDNIYASGISSSTTGGDFDYIIAKYDASGTLQYQRILGGAGNSFGDAITIDSADNIYVTGYTQSTGEGTQDILLAKLPIDGSLTGTYVLDGVNIVYAASSLTDSASTLTDSTSSLTAATSTLTSATSTLTSASISLIQHAVNI